MALSTRRRGGGNGLDAWPGYVDALSTLLMVIIFVLLVFVLAQAFLSVALSGREKALDRLNRQMSELTDMLSLERGHSKDLQASVAQLTQNLAAAASARDTLAAQLRALQTSDAQAVADRDAARAALGQATARLSDAEARAQSSAARVAALQSQIADAGARADTSAQQGAAAAAQLAAAQAQLATLNAQVASMKAQMADLDRTVTADKATIQARLSDLAALSDQVRALTALRDDLEKQVRDAAAKSLTDEQQRQAVAAQLADEQKFSDSARAQIALLNHQIDALRAQLQQVAAALGVSEKSGADKDAQIAALGQRLNVALASKVEELQRYRSEFFGRLREVLQNRPGIQIVGDRFVFQSEVLFPAGNADLSQSGQDQINKLATTLKQIAAEIPPDVNWILRVDGHADHQKVTNGNFPSNWELSTARAITVVKLLIADGVPADRLAATGFADFQPIDPADTPEAYAKNRRIELRLTDR